MALLRTGISPESSLPPCCTVMPVSRTARQDLSAYTDAGSVSAYAEKAVQWCVKNGILTGKTSSTLAPKATATRAECAAMLQRFASLTK